MGAYDCDCINNLEYDRRERKAQLSKEGATSDTISRQAAIDAIVQCTNCGDVDTLREYVLKHSLDNGWTGGILEALDAVKDLPPAQPERKMGRWLPDNRPGGGFWVCSCCKFPSEAFAANVLYKFCPNCGADMRGEQHETD